MTGVDHAVAMGWADPDPPRLLRLELRRLPLGLDRHADRPFQGGLAGAGLTNSTACTARTTSRTTWRRSSADAVDRGRQLPRALPHDLRRRRDEPGAADARRRRHARAAGAVGRVLPGAARPRQGRHLRPLPARGTRHRRAAPPDGPAAALRRVLRASTWTTRRSARTSRTKRSRTRKARNDDPDQHPDVRFRRSFRPPRRRGRRARGGSAVRGRRAGADEPARHSPRHRPDPGHRQPRPRRPQPAAGLVAGRRPRRGADLVRRRQRHHRDRAQRRTVHRRDVAGGVRRAGRPAAGRRPAGPARDPGVVLHSGGQPRAAAGDGRRHPGVRAARVRWCTAGSTS